MYAESIVYSTQNEIWQDRLSTKAKKLRDQNLGVFNEVLERYGISEWHPAE